MKKVLISLFLIFVFSCQIVLADQQNGDLSLIYFFSPACPQCDAVAPVLTEIGNLYQIQGLIYGTGQTKPMPFDVRKGARETSSRYGITKFPALVALRHGKLIQVFRGLQDIKDAGAILRAFRKGALSVTEAVEKGPGESYPVAGWVASRGEYFKDARFYLTDRKSSVTLKPWLPLEAVKAPFRTNRPRLMSDVIAKPVYLEIIAAKAGDELKFTVVKEIAIE